MANRTSIEKLNYQELLQLSITHLINRMKNSQTKPETKDKIATMLVSKAIPQSVNLGNGGGWEDILNAYQESNKNKKDEPYPETNDGGVGETMPEASGEVPETSME